MPLRHNEVVANCFGTLGQLKLDNHLVFDVTVYPSAYELRTLFFGFSAGAVIVMALDCDEESNIEEMLHDILDERAPPVLYVGSKKESWRHRIGNQLAIDIDSIAAAGQSTQSHYSYDKDSITFLLRYMFEHAIGSRGQ